MYWLKLMDYLPVQKEHHKLTLDIDSGSVRGSPNGTIGNFTNGTIGSQWHHWLTNGTNSTIGTANGTIGIIALPLVPTVLPMVR